MGRVCRAPLWRASVDRELDRAIRERSMKRKGDKRIKKEEDGDGEGRDGGGEKK